MTNVPQSRLPRNVRLGSLTLGVSAGLAVLMLATILAAWRHFEAAAEVYRSASLSGGMGDPLGELQWMRSDLGYDAAVVAERPYRRRRQTGGRRGIMTLKAASGVRAAFTRSG